ncbi:MAG: C39 family peptidase [Candidatus Kerfeldbacteria bacterium]
MKTILGVVALVACSFCITAPTFAASHTQGRVLLQVQARGEAWYVNPTNGMRYFLGRPADAYEIMRSLSLGITNTNLDKIPKAGTAWDGEHSLMQRVHGRVLLQVEARGEAWYVNPADGKRYYMKDGADAFRIMSSLGLGITNANLSLIPIAGESLDTMEHVPEPLLLSVPFQPQAPFADWNAPYNEACEEAILVMLEYYYQGRPLSAEDAKEKIDQLVYWQNTNYGYYEDTGVELTGRMFKSNYGRSYRTSTNVSVSSIIGELEKGHPVIIPVSGRDLGNPHFKGAGPIYHMILIIGYDNGVFITHDPGTRYGAFYRYDATRLVAAIHDLTNPESDIRNGQPKYLVIEL